MMAGFTADDIGVAAAGFGAAAKASLVSYRATRSGSTAIRRRRF